jgi:hypothetical protein
LILYLLLRRKWRAAAWTSVFGIAFVGATVALFGTEPVHAFLHYQLPRVASGEAFPWLERSTGEFGTLIAATNFGYYGLVTKLRAAGVPHMTARVANGVSWVMTVVLLALVVWAARTRRDRLREPHVWLALINLMALRSPFCPDGYATIGTLWLLTLLAPELPPRARWIFPFVLAWVLLAMPSQPAPGLPPFGRPFLLIQTAVSQLLTIGLNIWVLVRHSRTSSMQPANGPPPEATMATSGA